MSNSAAIALSLVALSGFALLLAVLVLQRFRREHQPCHLYWGVGLFLFFVTLVEEAALDFGAWSELLIQSYLILVAVLVGILSLGSAELSLSRRPRILYFGYIAVTSAALVVVTFGVTISTGIMSQGVVAGLPPTSVDLVSTLITVPAALLLILSSLYGVYRTHHLHPLYIALGTAVISAAGALYLVSFPATLYYAEFVGMLLLFLGFVKIPHLTGPAVEHPHPS